MFRTVFLFALRSFLPGNALLVSDIEFYIVITIGTLHEDLIW